MVDSDLLDQVQQAQGPTNADLVGAVHDNQWAQTFSNTPPAEVLRSRVNLADTINRAVDNKIALQAQGDVHALDLMQKTARFKEWQDQAPLREQLLQGHVNMLGATEKRHAAEALSQATDTTGLNNDIAQAYTDGLKPNTPEFHERVLRSIADHPHARADHVREVFKMAGGKDEIDPVEYSRKAGEMLDQAKKLGIKGIIREVGGQPVWVQDNKPDYAEHTKEILDRRAALVAAGGSVGFTGTPEEARDKYGPDATLHQTDKGIWTVTIPADAQAVADRASLKQQTLNELKPTQQEIVDRLVEKKKALMGLNPTDDQKIAYEVEKKKALQGLAPTDAQKITFEVAKRQALDAIKATPEQKIAFDVAHKKALDELKPTGQDIIDQAVNKKEALSNVLPASLADRKIAETNDAMINNSLALEFGHLDKTGKTIEPDSGTTKATHVNVRFTGPDGKVHDSGPMTIARYQELHQAVKGNGPAAPATPAPASTPAAERIATNPKTGEKVAFRNGQWVPLK